MSPEIRIRKGQVSKSHDQAEGPHPQKRADPEMHRNTHQQHQRTQARIPDENNKKDFPRNGDMCNQERQPGNPGHPGQIHRLIFFIGDDSPHRFARPPTRPLQLRKTRPEIDGTQMQLNQSHRNSSRSELTWSIDLSLATQPPSTNH